ncbi:thioredoxin family protein [Candidatus Woesearchaeota archaeon]|nr:thioredoxin family protein [Candidatus Woesearchaeota archaeon]
MAKKNAGKKTRTSASSNLDNTDPYLFDFYGEECPPCRHMHPLVDQLETEHKVKVAHLEVWHNEKNLELLQSVDKGMCGGVPFFFNKKTGKWICGATSYENLVAWAKGD